MAAELDLMDPALHARLHAAVLRARTLVLGNFTGIHSSPHKGASVEFLEHKRYSPGDELKHLDWKLLARSDRYYIKQFENETNLRALIMLDASASMGYGPTEPSKFEAARLAAAGLSYLLLSQADAVGMLTHLAERRIYVPARAGLPHYKALASALQPVRPAGSGAWVRHLPDVAAALPRRGLFILFSDLLADREAVRACLQGLRERRHDVILMHVLHRYELEFPFDELTLFTDMERPGRSLMADPAACRDAYLREIGELCEYYRNEARSLEMDYLLVNASEPLEDLLARYLAARDARLARPGPRGRRPDHKSPTH